MPEADPDKPMDMQLQGEVADPGNLPPGCAFAPRCQLAGPSCGSAIPDLLNLPDHRRVACHLCRDEEISPDDGGGQPSTLVRSVIVLVTGKIFEAGKDFRGWLGQKSQTYHRGTEARRGGSPKVADAPPPALLDTFSA